MGSSCSHSCNANCTSAVVVRNGKTTIALTTVSDVLLSQLLSLCYLLYLIAHLSSSVYPFLQNRFVQLGEELTMDYNSVTSSEDEWRAAICLCGMRACRGSFLHFATRDDLQQVLNRYCSPLYRFGSLAYACTDVPISSKHIGLFSSNGILDCALGKDSPNWLRKYALENLKFIEYERKSLPSALLRSSIRNNQTVSHHSFANADADARSVMESRIQAVVISFSVVRHLLDRQTSSNLKDCRPVKRYTDQEAVKLVRQVMATIPSLLETNLLDGYQSTATQSASNAKNSPKTKIINGIHEIKRILKSPSDTLGVLSENIVQVRSVLEALVPFSSSNAR